MTKYRFFLILTIFWTLGEMVFAKPTLGEFRQDIMEHRARVRDTALRIVQEFPERFVSLNALPKALREQFMETYLNLHDIVKIMSVTELRALGYQGDTSVLTKLHRDWGKALTRRPPYIRQFDEYEENLKDQVIKQKFADLPTETLRRCQVEVIWAEMVADHADTKIFRSAELGMFAKPLEAERHFLEFYNMPFAAHIARWIETVYYGRDPMDFDVNSDGRFFCREKLH